MLNIAAGISAPSSYNIDKSLRFRASASAFLSRTPASAGNRKTWTWSAWVKRGTLGSNQVMFISKPSGTNDATITNISFYSTNTLLVSGYSVQWKHTTQVFRDPSAWYHIVVTWDTTQATASDRVRVYVNGSQVTAFSNTFDPTLNFDGAINQADVHALGRADGYSLGYFDGYMAEVNFIDGQALTPASFGETNALTGVWQPARYTGSYGTNGFYLDFEDTSSVAALGTDSSGNGNTWTVNNISLTAGVTYDSMTDVPTLTSATTANYAVLNPLNTELGMTGTPSGGNLNIAVGGGKRSTIAARSGKWYWEFISNSGAASNFPMSGLYVAGLGTYWPGYDGNSFGYFQGGAIYYNGSAVLSVSSFTDGDLLGFAWDADTGKVWVAKNGTWQNSGNPSAGTGQVATISTGVDRVVGAYLSSGSCSINFGQRPFSYTPPTGFVALNTFNLPTATILKGDTVMDATLYTGNGSTQTITNAAGFKPDLVWVKGRSGATDHALYDSVRGTTKQLESNTTDAETTQVTGLTAFGSAGFTVGALAQMNTSAATYVGWQWQAGQGTTSSNTNGSITSQVSVNPSAGFSVITYTGNSVSGATVGHGLGVAPTFWVIKRRDGSGSWKALSTVTGAVLMGELNTQTTWASPGAPMTTAPTSTVITLDASGDRNGSGQTYVIYAFTPIAGFSYIGYFNGNGSTDGPFVYTGFRPKFTLSKDIEGGSYWAMMDSSRSPYNVASALLNADLSGAESTSAIYDYLSNGIKLRSGTNNQNNHKHIMISFAENPFKNSLAR